MVYKNAQPHALQTVSTYPSGQPRDGRANETSDFWSQRGRILAVRSLLSVAERKPSPVDERDRACLIDWPNENRHAETGSCLNVETDVLESPQLSHHQDGVRNQSSHPTCRQDSLHLR